MANPRQRRKQKSGTKSNGRRAPSTRNLVVSDPLIRDAWDPSKTVKQNFSALGLAEDVNRGISSGATRKKMMAWQDQRALLKEEIELARKEAKMMAEEAGVLDMTPVDFGEEALFSQLNTIFGREQDDQEDGDDDDDDEDIKLIDLIEEESKNFPKKERKVRPLSGDEREMITKLTAKHGTNFLAMAKDLKLNVLQHTPKQLESLYNRK